MRVGVAVAQLPFSRDEVALQAERLAVALRRAGHEAEIVPIPFRDFLPKVPEQMLACRLLDLEESMGTRIDRLVGLSFPAYLIPHSAKLVWLLRRHRASYGSRGDMLDGGDPDGDPDGDKVRRLVRQADARLIPAARAVLAPSADMAAWLRAECGVDAPVLRAPPPHAEHYRHREAGDFLLMPGPPEDVPRFRLVFEALQKTRYPVRLRALGQPVEAVCAMAGPLGSRVAWEEPDEERRRLLFGSCLAVVLPAAREGNGSAALEAMLSEKAVVTCGDCGAVAELVTGDQTGFVCLPEAAALAEALDRLWEDRALARRLGQAARLSYEDLKLSWDAVADRLLAG